MSRASETLLAGLHNLMSEAMIRELQDAEENELPISPQMFSAISKFLKDNEITCSIDAESSVGALDDEFSRMREKRRTDRLSVSSLPLVEEL